MKDEEFEVMKLLGDTAIQKNLWIKVYDDEQEKEGYIKLSEVIENLIIDIFEELKKREKQK
jgi:hypothetical protein